MDKHPAPGGHARSSRRKGERSVRIFSTDELIAIFDCADVYGLMYTLHAQRIHHYVAPAGRWYVSVTDHDLPTDVLERALTMFPYQSDWVGKGRPKRK
jgi:hypothetical protein